MKVTVTQDHINYGVRCSAKTCPIALAIMGMANVTFAVVAQGSVIVYYKDGVTKYYRTPSIADEFIRNFDGFLDVKPFEFELVPQYEN